MPSSQTSWRALLCINRFLENSTWFLEQILAWAQLTLQQSTHKAASNDTPSVIVIFVLLTEEVSSKSGTRGSVALTCTNSVRSSNKQHGVWLGKVISSVCTCLIDFLISNGAQAACFSESILVMLWALHSVRLNCYSYYGLEFSFCSWS